MYFLKKIFILIFLFTWVGNGMAQGFNYKGISIQGQHDFGNGGILNLDFLIIDYSGDTVWYEAHNGVTLTPENSYNLILGQGSYISGTESLFENVNWFNVDKVVIENSNAAPYLIAEFNPRAVPYAFHSFTVERIPFVYELVDVNAPAPVDAYLLKYNGSVFYAAQDLLADTVNFAWTAGLSNYSDTALVGISNQMLADSSNYSFENDTSNYSSLLNSSLFSDSTLNTDSSNITLYAVNNWSIDGNLGLNISNFVGTTNSTDFVLGTNNSQRLIFGSGSQLSNGPISLGYQMDVVDGALFQTNGNSALSELNGDYFYFDGLHSATGISNTSIPRGVDTTQANYSFHFGNDVSSPGKYATVFGLNSSADSSVTSGTTYEPVSSFAFGKNCSVSRYSVAIGDSAIANYYRNVAIGHNVIANSGSSSTAIGNNVLSTGATAWGAGKNIESTGNFSTAIGTNASTNGYSGTFVFGDNSTTDTVFNTAAHQFMVRADGGIFFYSSSDLSTGVQVSSGGGSWSMISDRNKKENIVGLNYSAFEQPILQIPVYSWTYKSNNTIHIGPMAQDFYQSFRIGEMPNYINMIDIDGITFLGIKAVNQEIDEELNEADVEKLEEEIETEKEEFKNLENRINALYEKLDN